MCACVDIKWPTGVEWVNDNTFINWDKFKQAYEKAEAALPEMTPEAAAQLEQFLADRDPYPNSLPERHS